VPFVCCNGWLDGALGSERGGQGRAVFKWFQPFACTLNEFPKNVVGNAILEHADSDGVVGVATKDFGCDAIRASEKFQAQTVADDVRRELRCPWRLHVQPANDTGVQRRTREGA
jgi:hypothetical protein